MGSTKACREHFMRQLASTRESLLSACGGHFSSSGSRDLQYWNTEISLISYIYIKYFLGNKTRFALSLSLFIGIFYGNKKNEQRCGLRTVDIRIIMVQNFKSRWILYRSVIFYIRIKKL